MDKENKLLDKVSAKTHVSKDDILSLAKDLQTKDLNKEQDIKAFVNKIALMTNRPVSDVQMQKIISIIQNNQVPTDIQKFV